MSHEHDNTKKSKTTWIKVHRKYLLPETLDAYNLPWKWDEDDPNYIIIKAWIDEDFQEDLFAHTRRIREGKVLPPADRNGDQPSILQDLIPNRNFDYEPPECDESEEPLNFDVNLKTSAVKRSLEEFRVDPCHRDHASRKIDVLSSRMPGFGKVVLYRANATVENQEPQFSWIHMGTETRSFDDFLRFASSVPNLADEDRALVLSLLKRTRLEAHGWAMPQDVIRCVGVNSRVLDQMTEERSAIFLRFPYYSIQNMQDAAQNRDGPGKHPRSLLQYFYNLESTGKRDLEQVIRKVGLFPEANIVHVPQLWAVIVNFRVIITSTPIALLDGASSSLEIAAPPAPKTSSSASIICVIDPRQRVFFFPIDQCKTYFAMRHNIAEHCLPPKVKDRGYDFELLYMEKVVIKAEDWTRLTTTHGSTILHVHVQILYPGGPKKSSMKEKGSAPQKDTEGSEIKREIEFEEHEDGETGKALIRYTAPAFDGEAGAKERRSLVQMRPVPPSSGLVVNQKPGDDPSSASNIYFDPTIPGSSSGDESVNQPDPAPSEGKDYPHQPQNLEKEPRPIGRSATFVSLFGEPSTPQASSAGKQPEINLDFPPVFTWPVAKRHAIDERLKSDERHKSSSEVNPGQGSGSKPRTQSSSNETTDASNAHEETIKLVSSHINNQLLGAEGDGARAIYEKATTMSYFDVDEAVKKQWAISLRALIDTAGQTEEYPAMPPWETALREVVTGLCRLFNFFVPLAYPCAVGDKFWGAVHDLIIVIPEMCDKSRMVELTQRTRRYRMTEAFFIADIGRPEYADLRGETDLDMLTGDIDYCGKCDRSRQYPTQSEAFNHLFECHFQASPEQRLLMSSESWWVMDFGRYLTFLCRMDGQQILRRLKHYLASLEKMAFQIQHGVSEDGKFDADTYRIPSSLVDAFQHILMMAVTGAHMAKTAYALRERYVDPDPLPSFLTPSESGKVPHFGSEAEVSMENAIRDIVLMTYTDEPSDVVTYEAVSPGLVMALIMGDSYPCRDPQNNLVDLVQTYRDYVLRLQFKVSQHPHRRLLQDIYLVCEELRIIRRISLEQRLVLGNYRNVLNPTSFRITTESRVSSFEREKARLNELILRIDADLTVIDSLVERLDSLATQTRNGVEVQQEDHGKAILVFTVVTVVFMPLSFVTSYLGMNTHDIRDMGSSQGLFWAISLPLTVVIIALVMVLAFQAERIREGFDTWFRHDRASIPKPARTVRRQKGTGKDIGRNSEPSTGVDWWGKNWLSTGKATGTKTKSVSSHVFNV